MKLLINVFLILKEHDYIPVCQYNEDCPPNKLCDRLNRRCINPCQEDSCGENAECHPVNHGIECKCPVGLLGNPYVECVQLKGCRSDSECSSSEACINGDCGSPCQCGIYANCEVKNHKAYCKCPVGYSGNPVEGCSPPSDPCDPNPCGRNAHCELDRGNPICFCPKGLTGNPFQNCIPEGDECHANACGPNSGCRLIGGQISCFCLPGFEGNPPTESCGPPKSPCDPSPCGPNTQCSTQNYIAKCSCLPGFIESPNTIRGCVEPKNQCEPNPCGYGAVCDSTRNPICYCPSNLAGNPFRECVEPFVPQELCKPGPCGRNSKCYVVQNQEQCYCEPGFMGDPYSGCNELPKSICQPNPCGPNAQCSEHNGKSVCRCPEGMGGDPTSSLGCHGYECQVDDECGNTEACIGFRCRDPCPGSCGVGAYCKVEKHHPVCFCNSGLTGNPVQACYQLDEMPKQKDPCNPSPCGVYSECKVQRKKPVCSCVKGYLGNAKDGCRPECVLNSDCPSNKACFNQRCEEACNRVACGINAECRVNEHTPMCQCPPGFFGDAFNKCEKPPNEPIVSDPCDPSPCDYGVQCKVYGNGIAICDDCASPDAIYNPKCRPECLSNSECPFNKACLGKNCLDPCPGSCGHNAVCQVVNHNPICNCPAGLDGNPYEQCLPINRDERPETCDTVQCGANTDCAQKGKTLSCVCKKNFFGNPLIGCRPECVINSDCAINKACVSNKCEDPCINVCGINSLCDVINHIPVCYCPPNHSGDALISCSLNTPYAPDLTRNPCDPSPCGANSRCLVSGDNAVCSCVPGYRGTPPFCQPECVVNSECAQNQACINLKCADPCPGTCGIGANCEVFSHNPICSCPISHTGDPFIACTFKDEENERNNVPEPINPCHPSPCGQNSICQIKQNRPVCSCVENFVGKPPYCRPECVLNTECPQDKACINEKCSDPCLHACGPNAECHVSAHAAYCKCNVGYNGDSFVGCSKIPEPIFNDPDPCYPSPCGENTRCTEYNKAAKCTCIPPYLGDPYTTGCRPECVLNSECPSNLACINQHCRDPCQGVCGTNAECTVANHIPICGCSRGFVGDAFSGCRKEIDNSCKFYINTHFYYINLINSKFTLDLTPENPCEPSPCGPNSMCKITTDRPTCSCLPSYIGAPPRCRPECVVNSECSLADSCINQKCSNPCVGTCGINAKCQVVNHNPICSCPVNYIGDPFTQCVPKRKP